MNGATFTTAGKYGNAVALDGINDYVDLGNPAALQLTGSMTVSAWIYATVFPGDDAAVVSRRNSSEHGFQLDTTVVTGRRTIGFKLTNSSGGAMFRYGATTLQTNTWYYITGVYDAASQTLHVYLNGQLDDGQLVGTVTATQQSSSLDVEIGQRPGIPGAFQFDGLIDDVRIADHAITQSQRKRIWRGRVLPAAGVTRRQRFLTAATASPPRRLTTAGNTTTTSAVTATVDTTADGGGDLALSIGDTTIDNGEKGAVAFTTSGIDGDAASATVTFSDGTHNVTVNASAGVADLSRPSLTAR